MTKKRTIYVRPKYETIHLENLIENALENDYGYSSSGALERAEKRLENLAEMFSRLIKKLPLDDVQYIIYGYKDLPRYTTLKVNEEGIVEGQIDTEERGY